MINYNEAINIFDKEMKDTIADNKEIPLYRIMEVKETLQDCRNELCLMCGKYKNEHLGVCDDCRWK